MEKKITKFDLNAAFKALDEIEIPVSEGLKANTVTLNEALKPTMKTDCLLEDYYDISNNEDLEQASAEREEEIKAAKLDKIEKIIDLDAKSPEDIKPSYIGKTIIQCPQCLTLFYKDPADIVVSEDDPSIVNIAEVCQHCGNTTGYTVIGKVGAPEAAEEPVEEPVPAEETPIEEVPAEEPVAEEQPAEETPVEEIPAEGEENLEEIPAEETEEAPVEEEPKEEGFKAPVGSSLVEQVTNALTDSVEESLNKSEENAPVEKHVCSENDSENLTLNEEVDLEEGKYGQTYRFYVRHKDGSESHFDQDGLKYGEIKQICAEEAEPDDVIFVSVCAVDEKGNETPLDKYSIDKYPKTVDPAEESLVENITTEALTEDVDLDKKLKEHNEYIEYLQKMIAQEEEALNNAKNEEVKAAIQRRLDGFKSDLEAALPEAVKNSVAEEELPEPEEVGVDSENKEEKPVEEVKTESVNKSEENAPVEKKHTSENDSENLTLNECGANCENSECEESLVNKEAEEYVDHLTTENRTVNEGAEEAEKLADFEKDVNLAVESVEKPLIEAPLNDPDEFEAPEANQANFKKMLNSPVFKQFGEAIEPVNEELDGSVTAAAETAINDLETLNAEAEAELEDINDEDINEAFSQYLTKVYSNVDNFKLNECSMHDDKLVLEGIITFKSGNTKPTAFEFSRTSLDYGKAIYEGVNNDLAKGGKFILEGVHEDGGKTLFTEKLSYSYHIGDALVEGCIEKKTKLIELFGIESKETKLNNLSEGKGFDVKTFTLQDNIAKPSEPMHYNDYKKADSSAKLLSQKSDILYSKVYFTKDSSLIIKYTKGQETESKIDDLLKNYKIDKKLANKDLAPTATEPIEQSTEKPIPVSAEEQKPESANNQQKNSAATKAINEYKKILAALKDAGIDTSKLLDGKKVTPQLKALRAALFTA